VYKRQFQTRFIPLAYNKCAQPDLLRFAPVLEILTWVA